MSHLVLYRNFRPKNFDEVIGQDHIVKTLAQQIKNNSVGHAYLFCGTRGTGKTSCAKIFARAVNCQNNPNGNPCGKCASCLSNENGGNLDIVEIDAASNNRVDEIRDLREKIGYLPSINKYKIYIIDEVHMLTDSAFNALLKTLEEPPEHVIFILATTEPHKLPATILSRCMRFDFRLVSEEDLVKHLEYVFLKSDIKSDKESLKLIARAGEGSVRDTLSIAQLCASYCSNDIKYEKCLECLGITDSEVIIKILSSIQNEDMQSLLLTLNKLNKDGKNFGVLVKDLTKALNDILTIKVVEGANELLSLPQEIFSQYQNISKQITSDELLEELNILSNLDAQLKLTSNIYNLVETTLLSLLVKKSRIKELENRVKNLEKKTISEKQILEQDNTTEKKSKNRIINDCDQSENGYNNQNDTNKKIENINDKLNNKQNENNENLKKNDEKLQKNSEILQKNEKNLENKVDKDNNKIENQQQEKDEKQIQVNKLFGELIILTRKKGLNLLYASYQFIEDKKVENDTLILTTNSANYQILKQNEKTLKDLLFKINSGLSLEIKETDKVKQETETFLKNKFKNKLTIS